MQYTSNNFSGLYFFFSQSRRGKDADVSDATWTKDRRWTVRVRERKLRGMRGEESEEEKAREL